MNRTTTAWQPLYVPRLTYLSRGNDVAVLDGEGPNWIITDRRGAEILRLAGEGHPLESIVRIYGSLHDLEWSKAWLHVHDFLRDARRKGIVSDRSFEREPYRGRAAYLEPTRLLEFWIHTNNSCNLTCAHCLVSSGPDGEPGLPAAFYRRAIADAAELGVERFYFTGGEPFLRKDLPFLIREVTERHGRETVILTNGLLFKGPRLQELKRLVRERVRLQISLDGATPATNDPLRGSGTFAKILAGIQTAATLGFEVTVTVVVTRSNLHELERLPALIRQQGARVLHLMWPHRRGRILEGIAHRPPSNEDLLAMVRRVKQAARASGVVLDNDAALRARIDSPPQVKYDLGNACWDSLCLYADGRLYPSASFAGHPGLSLGDLREHDLKGLWLESPVARKFREASVAHKQELAEDPFRFLTGGGDMEHSFLFSDNGARGSLLAPDPYYSLYTAWMEDLLFELAEERRIFLAARSGYDAPLIYRAMGEGAAVCGAAYEPGEVRTLHSNCVLAFDADKSRRLVREFYGKAAEEPQADLCCPVRYEDDDVSHIPVEVLDRFYGCGSPLALADIRAGETVVDLGSGAGIDCFIAAKKAGPTGRVIGVDMTEQMLAVADRNKARVAESLGFDVVEFRKGLLEAIPVVEGSVDLLTSNCVINLSPDKGAVFAGMWRALKDHGRIVVSDIVSDAAVPDHFKVNSHLWGECLSGALTEEGFLAELERAGFHGLEVLKKTFWKEIEGYRFSSVTIRGYKFAKKAACAYRGQAAIYRGPFKAVLDEEGHLFPRNEAVEVCTDTAAKLSRPPYREHFTVLGSRLTLQAVSTPQPSAAGCCAEGGGC
jgi:MoaA/NifB/PqqE/SkfB family radical SAM enzyme/ubiquinone/menaquinone biosynthesis C-methylase UbiE